MAYTIIQLSKLSGVTVRTIHYYEEIALFKPAYYGANGYRYYEEKQLLELQQILLFKKLGFSLKQIQKVVGKSDFDQLAALYSHKAALHNQREKIGILLKTVDKTIKHIQKKKKMNDKEMFDGFNIKLVKAKEKEIYFLAEKLVGQNVKNPTICAENVKQLGQAYYDNITKNAHAIFKELADCMNRGFFPKDYEVQKIIKKHYSFTEQTLSATKEVYKSLAQLYKEHPAFRKQLDPFHLNLATFMAEAMGIFSNREL